GDYAAAERAYEAALRAFPEYAGPENAYLGLAEVYHATNRPDARIDMLRRYLDIAEHDVAVALELAELLESRGDAAAATALRERSLYVAPYDAAVRTALADGYERDGAFDRAVLHRRAVVALNPPDRAGAQYRLAMSLFESGRRDEARRAVLMALEMAPGYREAQRLLLQIVQ
ncbi:MAG TPA: tetratricopeptide repeat protein, partial [Rhodothermales bacterium]